MSTADTAAPLPAPERDPRQPADFDPVAVGRHLLRGTRIGSLATLEKESGHPFATLTSVATDFDGAPLLLLSGLSAHTGNLLSDGRASLLLAASGKGDPLAHPRLSVQAQARKVDDPLVRRRFLARHPKAQLYVDFPDFAFFRLEPVTIHLNGGFARAFSGDARHVLSEMPDREAFADLEDGAIRHMNADHAEALVLYAVHLAKQPEARWQATGLDPHGLDLAAGDRVARVAFAEPVRDGGALRHELKRLADHARSLI